MLDGRKAAILCALVKEHIRTAQPVGSARIADSPGVDVSPATVRSEMASLEEQDYLAQPHTSAGRMPTAKAYRFYVNRVQARAPALRESDCQQVSNFFSAAQGGLSSLMSHTAWLLSDLTDWTGVVVSSSPATAVVRSAQLIKIASRKVLVLVVMSNGSVDKRVLDVASGTTSEVVADASCRLAAQVVGRALSDVGAVAGGGCSGAVGSGSADGLPGSGAADASGDSGVANGSGDSGAAGDMTDPLLMAALDALHEASEHRRVFVGGTDKLADAFDAVEQLRGGSEPVGAPAGAGVVGA